MRNEILSLIYRLLDEGKIVGPVLDVGGAGTDYQKEQGYDFKAKFESKGIEYKIVDISPNKGVDFTIDFSKTSINFKANTILCTEMLEHAKNPWKVIEQCYKHLNPGGMIIVTVPDLYGRHCDKDYYRFTENGVKVICEAFDQAEFGSFGSEERRDLEHYFVGRKKEKSNEAKN